MLNKVNPLAERSPQELLALCENGDAAACQLLQFGKQGWDAQGAQHMERFEEGGEVLLAPQEMMAPEMEAELTTQPPPLAALMDILGPEKSAELIEAMANYPVVEDIAEMATQTSDGLVEGTGGPTGDQVPARVSEGEYIFSAEAVQIIGIDQLEALHEEAKTLAAST